jgi:hypothetical protein
MNKACEKPSAAVDTSGFFTQAPAVLSARWNANEATSLWSLYGSGSSTQVGSSFALVLSPSDPRLFRNAPWAVGRVQVRESRPTMAVQWALSRVQVTEPPRTATRLQMKAPRPSVETPSRIQVTKPPSTATRPQVKAPRLSIEVEEAVAWVQATVPPSTATNLQVRAPRSTKASWGNTTRVQVSEPSSLP